MERGVLLDRRFGCLKIWGSMRGSPPLHGGRGQGGAQALPKGVWLSVPVPGARSRGHSDAVEPREGRRAQRVLRVIRVPPISGSAVWRAPLPPPRPEQRGCTPMPGREAFRTPRSRLRSRAGPTSPPDASASVPRGCRTAGVGSVGPCRLPGLGNLPGTLQGRNHPGTGRERDAPAVVGVRRARAAGSGTILRGGTGRTPQSLS